MPSAAFSINGAASPVAVAAGSTVNLALLSVSGVGNVEWSILGGSDSTKTAPTITSAGSPPGSTASFTMNSPVGSVGLSWIVQCKINSGKDTNGSPVAGYTSSALVYVLGSLTIAPFAAFESFERNATNGIADDLNSALNHASSGVITPTFTDTFTSTSATASVVRNIALSNNSVTRIVVITFARDTGNNFYKKKSSTEWTRAAGGGATQLGIEDGPVVQDNITVTGASVVANGNGIDLKYGGSGSVHTAGTMLVYVESISLAAAT